MSAPGSSRRSTASTPAVTSWSSSSLPASSATEPRSGGPSLRRHSPSEESPPPAPAAPAGRAPRGRRR
eukprot:12242333-Alexandrium_andersonii.AAC.1